MGVFLKRSERPSCQSSSLGLCVGAVLACLTFLSGAFSPSGLAEDERAKEATSPEEAWIRAVVAAARSGDGEELAGLAAHPAGDPWLAVDRIQGGGLFERAEVFAAQASISDAEHLRRYAAKVRDAASAARKALRDGPAPQSSSARAEAIASLDLIKGALPAVVLVRARMRAAEIHQLEGSWRKAAENYKAAEEAAAGVGWYRGQFGAITALFYVLEELGAADEQAAALARRLALTKAAGDERNALGTQLWQAGLEARSGRLLAAATSLRATLAGLEALEDWARAGEAHATLAQVLNGMGKFSSALHHSGEAERLFVLANSPEGLLYAREGSISTYVGLGLDTYARALCERQIEVAGRDPAYRSYRTSALLVLAIALARLGEYRESQENFDLAVQARAEEHDWEAVATARLNRGSELHEPRGNVERARVDYLAAAGHRSVSHRARGYGYAYLARLGRDEHARDLAEHALAAAQAAEDAALEVIAEAELARLALQEGDAQGARSRAMRALRLSQRAAGGLGSTQGAALMGRRGPRRAADMLMRASVAGGSAEQILEAGEIIRASTLLRRLGGRDRIARIAKPRVLLGRLRGLRADREGTLALLAGARDQRDRPKIRGLAKQLTGEDAAIAGLQARILGERARLARLTKPEVMSAEAIGAWLLPHEALVQFVVLDRLLYSVTVHRRDRILRLVEVPTGLAELTATLRPLESSDKHIDLTPGGVPMPVARLAEALFPPGSLPATAGQLIVLPPTELANVPWPLVGRHAGVARVVLAPSASFLRGLTHAPVDLSCQRLAVGISDYTYKRGRRAQRIYAGSSALGDLPTAGREARFVTRGEDVSFVDGGATEEHVVRRLRGDSRRRSIVHFACHGIVHPTQPGLSSLALRPTAAEDGFLSATELLGVPINADLVVLSACDVGSVHGQRGQGVHGLPTALLAAGGSRVLANLWRVDDEAGEAFMRLFYAALEASGDPQAALRTAQQELREKNAGWRHPYYWAGWVLWGSPR